MSTYRLRTLEVNERRDGSVRADLDSLEVLNVSPSGVRVAYLADEDSPVYDVEVEPVTDGVTIDTSFDRAVLNDHFAVIFEQRAEQ